MLEVPGDVSAEEVDAAALDAPAVAPVRSAGDPHDVAEAARALTLGEAARHPRRPGRPVRRGVG